MLKSCSGYILDKNPSFELLLGINIVMFILIAIFDKVSQNGIYLYTIGVLIELNKFIFYFYDKVFLNKTRSRILPFLINNVYNNVLLGNCNN